MGDQPSKLEYFLAELGRRHVVKVAVAYAAVAFVVLQLGEIILPAFSAEWALQYLVVFAVLGFPLVMVLAWVFDITPEGIRKTDAIDALKDYAPGMSSTGVLPRLALLTITMLAVGGLGWWWVESAVAPPAAVATVDGGPTVVPVAYDPNDPIRSLAVLPLDNFSDTGEQDYFAAGMHEALIARLSRLPAIRVVSRTSVARYSTTAKTIPEIAQELGVEGILEGSVTRVGDEVRITVQLIHGPSDTHVWTQSYTRDFADVLTLQGEVAEAIAWEIQGELTPEERATLSSAAPVSEIPEANDEFMKARYAQSSQTLEGLQAAMGHYREALEADPTFAPAYAGLAGTELMMEMADPTDPAASLERAWLIALKALEVDPDLAEAHDILTLIDERLGEEMGDPATRPALPGPGSEVRIVRRRGEGAVESDDFLMVIKLDSVVTANVGEFRMDSTRIFESMTEVGQQLPGGVGGMGRPEGGGDGETADPHDPCGTTAEGRGTDGRGHRTPAGGLRAGSRAPGDLGGAGAHLRVPGRLRGSPGHATGLGGAYRRRRGVGGPARRADARGRTRGVLGVAPRGAPGAHGRGAADLAGLHGGGLRGHGGR